MRPYVPHQANMNPPKKIHRIRQLQSGAAPKICVVRGEGLGDVIMTTPAISQLRQHFVNQAHITYATNTRYLDGALVKVLQGNPDIDQIIDREDIAESEYDTVLSLHCPAQQHEHPGRPPLNRIDIFAQHLGFQTLDNPVPRYFPTKEEIQVGAETLYSKGARPNDKVIMVNIFSSSKTRSLDERKYKEALIELAQLGYKMLIVKHATDWATEVMWDNIANTAIIDNADCRTLAGIMVHCDLLFCPDSSLMHLAGALSVPTVAVFGPTDPRARVNHYKNTKAIWHGEQIAACPCWYSTCPTNFSCLQRVSKDDIVQTCIHQINSTNKLNIERLLNSNNNVSIRTDEI